MIYTALELLKMSGVESPEEKIGKMSVSIEGVNIHSKDQIINLQDKKEAKMIVGVDGFSVLIPGGEGISEAAKAIKADQGKKATAAADELKKAKEEAARK